MSSTGTAPALSTSRAIIGPASTQGGFQYWYLACLPDSVIAVRQSIGAFFILGLSNGALPPIFGLVGGLLNMLVKGRVKSFRERTEAKLQSASASQLRVKGNIVLTKSQFKSITFKNKSFGTLVLPDLTIETITGKKYKYAMQAPDFEKACAQMKQMYPDFCR